MNPFVKEYKKEIRVLALAFLFAAISDLFYGGIDEAKAFSVGIVLIGASTMFSTVFVVMIVYRIFIGFFTSEKFRSLVNITPEYVPETKTKRAPTTSRTIKR